MKTLTTLIKYRKQILDGLRRDLVAIENQKTQLLQLIERLKEELARELKLAEDNPDMSYFFGDFSKRIRTREDNILVEIKKLDGVIHTLRDSIREAFAELKKYEIAEENRKREQQLEQNRKDTNTLDEVAAIQHQRKKGEK